MKIWNLTVTLSSPFSLSLLAACQNAELEGTFRAYWAKEAILNGSWVTPGIERLK